MTANVAYASQMRVEEKGNAPIDDDKVVTVYRGIPFDKKIR